MSKTHAEIREALGRMPSASHARHAERLANIAREVVALHRDGGACPDPANCDGAFDPTQATERFPDDGYQGLIEPRKDQDAELSRIDSSWHYRLPERWQG